MMKREGLQVFSRTHYI